MKIPVNFNLDEGWELSEDAEVAVTYPYPNKPIMMIGRLITGSVYGHDIVGRTVRLYNGPDGRKVRFTHNGSPYGGSIELL